jgi:glutaconate CoA-transferase subunit A
VAVPALTLDAAVVHVNRADRQGNGQLLDVDPYFDQLFLGAARDRYVSCDALVEPSELLAEGDFRTLAVSRHLVDGVVLAPGGAHPTSCEPAHPRDVAFLQEYAASAGRAGGWDEFRARWLDAGPEAAYQRTVAAS